MSDDLDALKQAMAMATPKPDTGRRAENIALAQKNFAKVHSARTKRAAGGQRWWLGLTGRSGALIATVTAACGFLLLTLPGQTILQPPGDADITLTELAAPQLEQGPLLSEDLSDDLLSQEPLREPFGEVVQAPPPAPDVSAQRSAPVMAADSEALMSAIDSLNGAAAPPILTLLGETLARGNWPQPEEVDIARLFEVADALPHARESSTAMMAPLPWDRTSIIVLVSPRVGTRSTQLNFRFSNRSDLAAIRTLRDEPNSLVFEVSPNQPAGEAINGIVTLDNHMGTEILREAPRLEMTSTAAYAAAVYGFGRLLRGELTGSGWTYADAIALAEANISPDPTGQRAEMIALMRLAQSVAAGR